MLRVSPFAVRIVVSHIDKLKDDQSPAELECCFYRICESSARASLHRESIDHHFDGVLFLLFQGGDFLKSVHHPIHSGPTKTLGLQLLKQVNVFTLARPDQWREHLETASLIEIQDPIHDLLRCLAGYDIATLRAVGSSGSRIQQAQVVIDLGDRSHG